MAGGFSSAGPVRKIYRCFTFREELVKSCTVNTTRLTDVERQLAEISNDVDTSIRMVSDDVQLKVCLLYPTPAPLLL